MIYTRPFITNRFVAYAGESHRLELSLAVAVVDAFTDRQPEIDVRVRLKELPQIKPFRTDRGFFVFEGRETVKVNGTEIPRVGIPDGNYTLVIEPDLSAGDWFYLQPAAGDPWTNTFERPITLPLPNPLRPLEEVKLSPKSSYPFPANATLVRGKVRQGGANVAEAVVSTTYDEVDPADTSQTLSVMVETLTDREGDFVLFFKKLPLKTQTVTIEAIKGGPAVPMPGVVITEGTTLKNQIIDLP